MRLSEHPVMAGWYGFGRATQDIDHNARAGTRVPSVGGPSDDFEVPGTLVSPRMIMEKVGSALNVSLGNWASGSRCEKAPAETVKHRGCAGC